MLNSLSLEVLVCPGQCVDTQNRAKLNRLQWLNKQMYKQASLAQHASIAQCKTRTAGVAATHKVHTNLGKSILECHSADSICK